jgi:hypothetical protein
LELRVVVRFQPTHLGTAARKMDRSKVQMNEGSRMPLCSFMLVRVQEGRLHEGKQQRQAS